MTWTWWMTLLAIFVVLVLIGCIPVGVDARYSAEGVFLSAKIGPFLLQLLPQKPKKKKKQPKQQKKAEKAPAKAEPQMIYVYVCGAVRDPGVVEVPEGSRAEEALRLVGGMTAEADPFYVNLAETVTDGQKLYFPTLEEAETLEAEVKATAEGLVNINTASAEELCALPGIGASRAADIVRYREQNGAFQTKEDIMKVSGIKQNAYDKLCDKITVQ